MDRTVDDLKKIGDDLRRDSGAAMDELQRFVTEETFQEILMEMYSLVPEERHHFVESVWLCRDQLQSRGLQVPQGVVIQRSTFADNRPTLFCVTKLLPPGLGWNKVTVTFDNALPA